MGRSQEGANPMRATTSTHDRDRTPPPAAPQRAARPVPDPRDRKESRMNLPNRPVLLVVLALALAFGLLVAAWSPHTAAAQASTKQLDVHAVNAPAGASWSISSNAGFGDQTFSFSQSVQVAPGT